MIQTFKTSLKSQWACGKYMLSSLSNSDVKGHVLNAKSKFVWSLVGHWFSDTVLFCWSHPALSFSTTLSSPTLFVELVMRVIQVGHSHDAWLADFIFCGTRIAAVIILPWTPKICLECLLCFNQSHLRSSHHRNHRQRTVSYRSRNKFIFSFCSRKKAVSLGI